APVVRDYFPETMLWRPEVITDDEGRASVGLTFADSITTWRLSARAVTADGRLGAAELPLKVVQPFFVDANLPVALTRNDEVTVPVVVYNYSGKSQIVKMTLEVGDWCEQLDPLVITMRVDNNTVASYSYRL